MSAETELLKQRVGELDGSRRHASPGRAAVRLDDLATLMRLDETLKSAAAVGATPTKAEFDKLVQDMQSVHMRLLEISTMLKGRLRR